MFSVVNHNFDVPFLAGLSNDRKTMYVDSRLQNVQLPTHEGYQPLFSFVMIHEAVEKLLMDYFGQQYPQAHDNATATEHNDLLLEGVYDPDCPKECQGDPTYVFGWYEKKILAPHEHVCETVFNNLPPDLDMTTYEEYAKHCLMLHDDPSYYDLVAKMIRAQPLLKVSPPTLEVLHKMHYFAENLLT